MRSKICFCFLLLLNSCQIGPSYDPPMTFAPEHWKHQEQKLTDMPECPDCWWKIFDDPLLNQLEQSAVENNHSVFAAVERVIQARALAGVSAADLYPQITLSPYFTSQGVLQKLFHAKNATSQFLHYCVNTK